MSENPISGLGKILITAEQIEQRVSELAWKSPAITRQSEKLMLLGLLRGSVVLMTDLMRKINRPLTMDFMSVSSYAGSESSGFVRIESDHKIPIQGWDVILVDDIIDTGYTIQTVRKLLQGPPPKKPADVRPAG